MKNKFKDELGKKINIVFLILLIVIILITSVYFYKRNNSIKVICITSGFAPHSEEVICTVSKSTKNKKIRNIVLKECKSGSIIIEKDGEIKEVKYGEKIWIGGVTGQVGMLSVDGPVYYLKFEK